MIQDTSTFWERKSWILDWMSRNPTPVPDADFLDGYSKFIGIAPVVEGQCLCSTRLMHDLGLLQNEGFLERQRSAYGVEQSALQQRFLGWLYVLKK